MVEDDAPPGVETTAIVPKMASTSWWEQDKGSRKVAVGCFNKGLDVDVLYLVLDIRRRLRNIQAAMMHQTKQITNKQRTRHKIRSTRLGNANTGECDEILIHFKGFPKRSMVPRRLPTMLLTQQQWRSHCSVTLAHTSEGKLCFFVLIHMDVIPCLSCLSLLVPGSQMRGRSPEFCFSWQNDDVVRREDSTFDT